LSIFLNQHPLQRKIFFVLILLIFLREYQLLFYGYLGPILHNRIKLVEFYIPLLSILFSCFYSNGSFGRFFKFLIYLSLSNGFSIFIISNNSKATHCPIICLDWKSLNPFFVNCLYMIFVSGGSLFSI